MNPIKRIFCSAPPKSNDSSKAELDPNIAKICSVINKLKGCRTSSSCPQHFFPDDESEAPTESIGRHAYITVICNQTQSLAVLIDAFTTSPYRWKFIIPKRHHPNAKLECDEIRIIFQYSFDNPAGRNKEFDRLSKCIGEYVKSV